MMLRERLQKARATLTGGWTGPQLEQAPPWANCLDTQGAACSLLDEGVARYSTIAAVALFCSGADEIIECLGELERIATPTHFYRDRLPDVTPATSRGDLDRARLLAIATIGRENLEQWLGNPARQIGDVLRVFDGAINKLKGEG